MLAISLHEDGLKAVLTRLNGVGPRVASVKGALAPALHGRLSEHFKAHSAAADPARSGKTRRERRERNGRPFRKITVSEAVIEGEQIRIRASTPVIREETAEYALEKAGIRFSSGRNARVARQFGLLKELRRAKQASSWSFNTAKDSSLAQRGLPAPPNADRLAEFLRARGVEVLKAGGGL
jgi:hypothetical protein